MALKSDPSTWKDPRHRKGVEGEEMAKQYLLDRGWMILAHRFRMGRLEIDFVARRGPVVAFVEVKTRWSSQFGSPLEAITWHKRREITRVASAWIDRFGRQNDSYRFDVIGISRVPSGGWSVEHVEDAFRVERR